MALPGGGAPRARVLEPPGRPACGADRRRPGPVAQPDGLALRRAPLRGSAPPSEVLRPETQELRRTLLEGGMRAAALTNDLSRFHDGAWIEQMDVLDKFDPFVDLSNSGVLKPDPRGCQRVIDRIGLARSGSSS